jgi:phenylalanine ammonia-lyase
MPPVKNNPLCKANLMSLAATVHSKMSTLTIDGQPLSIAQIGDVANGQRSIAISNDTAVETKMAASIALVDQAVTEGWSVYGVTTGFGGMANVPVPMELAAASQNNLLSFLAAGAGQTIDIRHTRVAMVLRANVLMQGCSGVRKELVQRIVDFLNHDAIPEVCELGSIGASGDLVPLSAIARAITGHDADANVTYKNKTVRCSEIAKTFNLPPLQLRPKEGLALVNGTSFSAAIAANCVAEIKPLMALSLAVNAMMMKGLSAQTEPFDSFVHQHKPHPGQIWTAQQTRRLLKTKTNNSTDDSDRNSRNDPNRSSDPRQVQDRYSIRCFAQYFGPVAEGISRIEQTVVTEMNSVSDNPLIASEEGCFYQSGNFLGQYVGIAMDELRKLIGLTAKHLDVQIATLVSPEFNQGLPASLRGNDQIPYNMGLKGLQITGNSIQPMLSWYGNPIVDLFPTHAEQFNQNINGLSWGSANLAWKSIELFQHYLCVSLIFAVQAIDLRCVETHGHADSRRILDGELANLYNAVYQCVGKTPGKKPLIFNDGDQTIQSYLACLFSNIATRQKFNSSLLNSVGQLQTELDAFTSNDSV